MRPDFRHRLRGGDLLIGTIINLSAAAITEVFVEAGYDFVFIDTEHGSMDIEAAQRFLQVAHGCACIVRVPDNNETWIKKTLDIGADWLIVPLVNDANVARQVAELAKYPPMGSCSVGLARAHGYGMDFQGYVQRANNETAIVVQAEHISAVENMSAIVKVEGIDAILSDPTIYQRAWDT